jgi:hypothetical protein
VDGKKVTPKDEYNNAGKLIKENAMEGRTEQMYSQSIKENDIEGFEDHHQYTSAFFLKTMGSTWLTIPTTLQDTAGI